MQMSDELQLLNDKIKTSQQINLRRSLFPIEDLEEQTFSNLPVKDHFGVFIDRYKQLNKSLVLKNDECLQQKTRLTS